MRLFILLLSVFLTGCASMGNTPTLSSWPLQQQRAQALQTWTLKGQVGIHTQTQGSSFSVLWQQLPRQSTLHFFGPLGLGNALLEQTPQNLTLSIGNKRFTAQNPETLLQEQLGWPLPVTNLYFWIRGIPAPNAQASWQIDAQRQVLLSLSQQGWYIQYLHYQTVKGLLLPDKIYLARDNLQAKIIIRQWTLD